MMDEKQKGDDEISITIERFVSKMRDCLHWLSGYGAGMRDPRLDSRINTMFKLNKRLADSYLPKDPESEGDNE